MTATGRCFSFGQMTKDRPPVALIGPDFSEIHGFPSCVPLNRTDTQEIVEKAHTIFYNFQRSENYNTKQNTGKTLQFILTM
jgi:hypothetical protein